MKLVETKISGEFAQFLSWADEVRLASVREALKDKGFRVRTNADLPRDAKVARQFGAEGIGLCRTEHMFFDAGKLDIFQEMIVAEDVAARKKALKKLLPLQRRDFVGIFKEMDGLPVTVRLLDPPLHEFVPKTKEDTKALADKVGIPVAQLNAKIASLHELNPMLGHRGCRLGVTYPEIYDMQVQAIMEAAVEVAKKGVKVLPEIMIPLTGTKQEMEMMRANALAVIEDVFKKQGQAGRHPGRHHDRDSARRPGGGQDRRGGRVLLLRHQRPHPDDLRLLPRRRRRVPAGVHREGRAGEGPLRRPGRGGRRPAGGHGRSGAAAPPARS